MDDAELRAIAERIERTVTMASRSRVIVPVPAMFIVAVLIVSLGLADRPGDKHSRPWIAICALGLLWLTWEVVTATPEGIE